MPHNPIRVVVGPANYFSHPGSFNHLHDFFTDEQLSRTVWIYGERAIAAAQTKLPPAFELPGVKHYFVSWSLQRKRCATTGGGVR